MDFSAGGTSSSSSSSSASSSMPPSSVATPLSSMARSAEEKLRKKVMDVRKKCQRLKKKLNRAKQVMPSIVEEVVKSAANFLPPVAHRLFAAQIIMASRTEKGRRWTGEMKDFALKLYFHSPRSYRFLRKIIHLPSTTTLARFKSLIPLNTGVHRHVIDFLRDEVPEWADEKKLCTLVFDEVPIKRNLSYDIKHDKVVGLVDGGFSRKNHVADHALVAMVKGTVTNWKQVIGHWFTSRGEGTAAIESAVYQCLDQLSEVGLKVNLMVCDQGAKNRSFIKRAGITPENPSFMYKDEKIFFMWDNPHLFKSMRNNLIKYNFKWKNGVAKWEHIVSAVKNDDPLRLRLIPKVQPKHVDFSKNSFHKMKVKLATQVLSRSMSTALLVLQVKGILPAEAVQTADMLQDMNDLFDCFNSSKLHDNLTYRYALSESSRHGPFLNAMLGHLTEAQFLNCPRQPDCLRGLILNIRSLLMFREYMQSNYGVRELKTRLLNQDCLENTFSIIRQQHGCSGHPTAKQLESGLKSLSLSSMSKLSTSSNYEDDELEKALVRVSKLKVNVTSHNHSDQDIAEEECLDNAAVIPAGSVEGNDFYYCCGFITKQFLKSHNCDYCKNKLLAKDRVLAQDYQLFTYFKAFSEALGEEFGNFCLPSEHSFRIFQEMEGIFFNRFHAVAHRSEIARIIMDGYALKALSMNLCSQTSEINFQKRFTTTRIFWEIRSLNRRLRGPESDKRTTIQKLYKLL